MDEKIKEIVELRDRRLEEAKKETDEKYRFAGFCVVNALGHVLDILGYEPEENPEELDELLDELKF